jgi:anti-sigma factor RsiW
MRHIPDDELHAYLDQALSRAQCVEIESHLAHCGRCRSARDQIAALRDRTTSLLASLGPSRVSAPAWDDLALRAEQRRVIRRRRWESAAWAASLFLAVGLGYSVSQVQRPAPASVTPIPAPSPIAATTAPAPAPSIEQRASAPATVAAAPAHRSVQQQASHKTPTPISDGTLAAWFAAASHSSTTAAPEPPNGVEVSSLTSPNSTPAQNFPGEGLWRTVPLDSAQEGGEAARVDGLQVLQVQVHQVGTDGQITAVEQRLVTGEVIRTVEGPASLLADLMAHQIAGGDSTGGALANGNGSGGRLADATLTRRVGNRVVLLSGPPEMLSTLMTRLKVAATH